MQYVAQNQSVPLTYDASIVNFAHPQMLTVDSKFSTLIQLTSMAVIGEQGPTWFFAAIMFNFVVCVGAIVQEKEQKLRAVMQIMGVYVPSEIS